MSRLILAGALCCVLALPAFADDPYACFGAGRYDAMREGKQCASRDAEVCTASFYGDESGPVTASGARFDKHAMTCAHNSAPFDTWLRVTRIDNGRSILCRVNDRGPHVRGRCVDLSEGAARALGLTEIGIAKVRVE